MAAFDPELISAYLDDELSRDERTQVEAWLAESEEARQVLEQLRAVSAVARELPRKQLGEVFSDEVLRAIGRRRPPAPGTPRDGAPRPTTPLVLVDGDAAEGVEHASPPLAKAATPRSGSAGRQSVRHWYWMAPVAGLAAAVLVAVWVTQQGTEPEQIAHLPEASATRPDSESMAEGDRDDVFAARGRASAAPAVPRLSKAPADSPADEKAAPSLDSTEAAGERRALGGFGGAGLGGEREFGGSGAALSAKGPVGQRAESREAEMPALEQSVEELNPALAIQSISQTGAAVVWVTSPDHRAGISALQQALQSNAVLTEQPVENAARDKSADVVKALQSFNRDLGGEGADALYVEANAEQLTGTLRLLKQRRKPSQIARIKLQAISPEDLQQKLDAQLELGEGFAGAVTSEALSVPEPAPALSGDKSKANEEQKARSNGAASPRAVGQQKVAGSDAGRQLDESFRYGRQVQLKWRAIKQEKPPRNVENRVDGLQVRSKKGAGSATSPMDRRSGGKSANDVELLDQAPAEHPGQAAPAASAPPARRRSIAGKEADATLRGTLPAPTRSLKVLFVFEPAPSPPERTQSKPAP